MISLSPVVAATSHVTRDDLLICEECSTAIPSLIASSRSKFTLANKPCLGVYILITPINLQTLQLVIWDTATDREIIKTENHRSISTENNSPRKLTDVLTSGCSPLGTFVSLSLSFHHHLKYGFPYHHSKKGVLMRCWHVRRV